jgi:hypothetical protein
MSAIAQDPVPVLGLQLIARLSKQALLVGSQCCGAGRIARLLADLLEFRAYCPFAEQPFTSLDLNRSTHRAAIQGDTFVAADCSDLTRGVTGTKVRHTDAVQHLCSGIKGGTPT